MANRIVTWWFISAVEQVLILTSFDKLERQHMNGTKSNPVFPKSKAKLTWDPCPLPPPAAAPPSGHLTNFRPK